MRQRYMRKGGVRNSLLLVDTDGRLSGTGNVKNEDPKRSEIQNRKAGKSVRIQSARSSMDNGATKGL